MVGHYTTIEPMDSVKLKNDFKNENRQVFWKLTMQSLRKGIFLKFQINNYFKKEIQIKYLSIFLNQT